MNLTSVSFSGAGSAAGAAAIASYTCAIDGTGAGTGPTLPHVFQDTALHAITLTVTDAANCTGTASQQVQAKTMTGTWSSVDSRVVRIVQLTQTGSSLTGQFCLGSCSSDSQPVAGSGMVGPGRAIVFNAISSTQGGLQLSSTDAAQGGIAASGDAFTGKVIGPRNSSAFQQGLTLTFTRQ